MCDQYIKSLKPTLETLTVNLPLSYTLKCVLDRDFALISQREAYETLRYILTACGELVELSDKAFSDIRWKSTDAEVKKITEKSKNYVFESIKHVSKENKVFICKLKKSDLLIPYCQIFFQACLSLASYALSYQLSKIGIYFWPRMVQGSSVSSNMRMLLTNLEEEDKNNFEHEHKKISKEIDLLENNVFKIKEKKKVINLLLENEISKCKCKYDLRNESSRSKIITDWKQERDDLYKKNLQRIKSIEYMNEQLNLLSKLLDMKERFIINGEELMQSIPLEVEDFSKKNELALCSDNLLNLSALFKTIHLSVPKAINNKEIITELLTMKPPKIDTGLQQKLNNQKKKLEERIKICHNILGENAKTEAAHWLEDFLVTIPKVNFQPENSLISTREPIFDKEKLLNFIEFNDKNFRHEINGIEITAKKDKEALQSFTYFSRKNGKETIDPLKAVKKIYKKHGRLCTKRKSISLMNLSSAASFMISEKADSSNEEELPHKLCSTPKENYNRSFIYDKSISPISVHSTRDKSMRRQNRIDESHIFNDSILTEKDIQASLLNSYLSTDIESKTEGKQETFDSNTSIQDISFDATPSTLSIN